MRELFDAFEGAVDVAWMLKHTEALWRLELGQRSRDQRKAARYAEKLLRGAGLEQVERIEIAADGKTVHHDAVMPLGWDVTVGKLTILRSPASFAEPVVADYQRHPFHVVHGSVGVRKGGVISRLVTQEQMASGCDVRGAMVVLAPETRPRAEILRMICDLGGLGFVTDQIKDRYVTPDGVSWVNACTETQSWHVTREDRAFVGFSVSPRVGDQLRAAARAGEVVARVESDGRRFAGKSDVVTATLPGKDSREVWVLSHLYEPLPDDNSAGCVAAVEIARVMGRLVEAGRLPRPRFTLRLVMGWELYGFAAYADLRGKKLKNEVIGAINLDAMAVSPAVGRVVTAPACVPFFGDAIIEELFRECREHAKLGFKMIERRGGSGDDQLLNDSTIGVPTVWPLGGFDLWHNSAQTMDVIEPARFAAATAFAGAWVARVLTMEGVRLVDQLRSAAAMGLEAVRAEAKGGATAAAMGWRVKWERGRVMSLAKLGKGKKVREVVKGFERGCGEVLTKGRKSAKPQAAAEESVWDRIAGAMVPKRVGVGLPQDQARAPKALRRALAGGGAYGPMARVLANMDGKRTLAEVLAESAWEAGAALGAREVKAYVGAVEYLTDHGYLKTRYGQVVKRGDIAAGLRRAGIRRGDVLMLHSGMAALGHVAGGADAVIDGVLDVLGPGGTLLMPTFTQSQVCAAGTALRMGNYRPYHPGKSEPWTGRITSVFMKRKGVMRSGHPTHSVAGIGPLAAACLKDHAETDAPVCRRSPFGRLLDHEGKIAWLGADMASSTMIHLIEDELKLPVAMDVLCRVERSDGSIETVHVPGWPGGHREFYRTPGEDTKIYRRLIADGLSIQAARVGFGDVKVAGASDLFERGMTALGKEPGLILCDSEACLFCRQVKGEVGSGQ